MLAHEEDETPLAQVADAIVHIAETEKSLEKSRYLLVERSFDLSEAFRLIDSSRSGAIHAEDLLRFFIRNYIRMDLDTCKLLIASRHLQRHTRSDNLSRMELADLILPQTNQKLKDDLLMNYSILEETEEHQLEDQLSHLLRDECDFITNLETKRHKLASVIAFGYNRIDTRGFGHIEFYDMDQFLQSFGYHLDPPAWADITRRMTAVYKQDPPLTITKSDFLMFMSPAIDVPIAALAQLPIPKTLTTTIISPQPKAARHVLGEDRLDQAARARDEDKARRMMATGKLTDMSSPSMAKKLSLAEDNRQFRSTLVSQIQFNPRSNSPFFSDRISLIEDQPRPAQPQQTRSPVPAPFDVRHVPPAPISERPLFPVAVSPIMQTPTNERRTLKSEMASPKPDGRVSQRNVGNSPLGRGSALPTSLKASLAQVPHFSNKISLVDENPSRPPQAPAVPQLPRPELQPISPIQPQANAVQSTVLQGPAHGQPMAMSVKPVVVQPAQALAPSPIVPTPLPPLIPLQGATGPVANSQPPAAVATRAEPQLTPHDDHQPIVEVQRYLNAEGLLFSMRNKQKPFSMSPRIMLQQDKGPYISTRLNRMVLAVGDLMPKAFANARVGASSPAPAGVTGYNAIRAPVGLTMDESRRPDPGNPTRKPFNPLINS